MKRETIKLSGATACVSILEDRHGQWMQCTFSIVPDVPQPFPQQLSTMLEAEAAVFEKFGISQRLLPPTQGRWAAGDPTGFIPVVNEVE